MYQFAILPNDLLASCAMMYQRSDVAVVCLLVHNDVLVSSVLAGQSEKENIINKIPL